MSVKVMNEREVEGFQGEMESEMEVHDFRGGVLRGRWRACGSRW